MSRRWERLQAAVARVPDAQRREPVRPNDGSTPAWQRVKPITWGELDVLLAAALAAEGRQETPAAATGAPADLDRAMAALRAIVYASDGCQGHAGCEHSMAPWQEARRLVTAYDNREDPPLSDTP